MKQSSARVLRVMLRMALFRVDHQAHCITVVDIRSRGDVYKG